MYRAKTFCQKLLLNQQGYFKHLLLILLLGSSIAAFAGLYANQGSNLLQFAVIKTLFSKKEVPAYADSIRYLKATNITTTGATLSWEKTTKDETFTVTLYKKGVKVKSINTSSGTATVNGLEAGTTYTWKVTGSVNNSTSATASFTTMGAADVVEGEGPIGQVVIVVDDPFGGGGSSGCTVKTWVKDADGDGVMLGNTAIRRCDSPGEGYVIYNNQLENDCDDTNPLITTQIVEWVLDADADGYYTGTTVLSCETDSPGAGYVKKTNQLPGDCNDNPNEGGAAVNPGATEIYDAIDNDCDGGIDEGLTPPLPTSLTATTPGFQDYIIPAGITSVSLDVQGAKGGSFGRTLRGQPSGSINGGVGRRINTKFNVDANCEQGLKPGGILRLIVGATPAISVLALDFPLPESQNLGQGGGGGSAILYKAPGSSEWVVLVVAGGGGGAATVYSGQGATTINGLPGIGPNSDANTGQNTQGGKSAFTTTTVKDPSDPRGEGTITTTTTYSGGGGGMLGDAIGNCGGRKGLDAGADGGTAVVCSGGRQGGAGFGAGGTGINGGGGGGGYSGGNGGTIAAGGYGAGSFANSNGVLVSSANGTNVDNGLITITTSTTANSTSLAINCPQGISINSCSMDAVETQTTLAFNSTGRSITEQELIAAGGSITKGACAAVATISYIDVEAPASTSTKKIIERTFTVTDTEGAQATCTQTITVEDTEAPVLVDPEDVTGTNDAGFCYKVVMLTAPSATDNCGISVAGVTASGIPAGNKFPVGTTEVTWSVTDIHGNTSTQKQSVTITDTEAPVLADPADVTGTNDAGFCYKVVMLTAPSATDNCGISVAGVTASGIPADNKFPVGTTEVTWSVTDIHGNTSTQKQNVTITDNEPPVLAAPVDVTGTNDAGFCYKVVTLTAPSATDNCGISVAGVTASGIPAGNKFPVGTTEVTWSVTDIHGNTSTQKQSVTITDNEPPVLVDPEDVTGTNDAGFCYKVITLTAPSATDNCGISVAGVTASGIPAGNKFPVGTTEVTWSVTDIHGNTSTQKQNVTIADTEAPKISSVTANPSSLWPPNHKMKPVTVITVSTDNCGTPDCKIISVTSNEPENGTGDGDLGPDWEITGKNTVNLRAERAGNGNGRIYTITVECKDASGNASTSTTNVVVAHNITAPMSGASYKIGSTVNFAGTFWDVPGSRHSARWVIDGTTVAGKVTAEPSGLKNGIVAGSYKFNTAGVYKLRMEVIDQNGNVSYANTNGDVDAIVVIYDPNGGYTFGGGSFNIPTGKVSYGFQNNYFKTATNPKGETQLEFKNGEFEFNALNFEYLAVSGAKAQFRGSGKITDGQSGISFIMTVIDGAIDKTNIDKVRIKIFNKNTGEVYFDNQPGASDAADPTTAVNAGSTIVIGGSGKVRTEQETIITNVPTFEVITAPNPSDSYFTLTVKSSNTTDRILVRVMDELGRVVEQKENVMAGTTVRFGDKYIPGMYFISVQQGKNSKTVKLIRR